MIIQLQLIIHHVLILYVLHKQIQDVLILLLPIMIHWQQLMMVHVLTRHLQYSFQSMLKDLRIINILKFITLQQIQLTCHYTHILMLEMHQTILEIMNTGMNLQVEL